ncbi:MAG: Smr/MutS family protein [Acidobacteriota bacterium]
MARADDPPPGAPSADEASDAIAAEDVELFRREIASLRSVPDKDAAPEPPHPAAVARETRRLSRRLRRRQQKPPGIDEVIDLHGAGRESAVDRLDRELPAALARGARRVLVITGRGRGSAGGVALVRGAVVSWMRLDGRRWVERWEPHEHSSGGALLVWLRRR